MSAARQPGQQGRTPAQGSFGSLLVSARLVKQAELDEAKQSRSVYGGRLGTNLVELGYLGLEELATQLAAYHDVAIPPIEWLEAPDPKAMKLVPMSLIRKLKLLPLFLEREAIHVAMLDPRDPDQLEFVATAASRPVVSYVLPEIRLLYWLEVHLQIDRHPRYVNLAARLRRTDMSVDEAVMGSASDTPQLVLDREVPPEPERKAAPEPAESSAAPELLEKWFNDAELDSLREPEYAIGEAEAPPAPADAAAEEQEELLLEELFEAEAEESQGERAAPTRPVDQVPLRPAQVAELEATMDGASRTDDIVDLVLRLALTHCEAAVLFLVRGEQVVAYRRAGAGGEGALDAIELPLHVHSIFAHPAVTGFAFRGSPPEGGVDARVLTALERDDIQELLVQPVSIGGRVVNLLYCDNGGSAFGETSIAALGALADRAAVAYERLILERKRSAA